MILDEIVADKKKRLQEQRQRIERKEMERQAYLCKRESISFLKALKREGLSIIGEFKQASPSMGEIKSKIPLAERIAEYNSSVDAISCLTEEDHFHGRTEDLKEIRTYSKLPILRKDFIIEPYQIFEAKLIGADAILLIAAILQKEEMKSYFQLAKQLGLDVLTEVHDRKELEMALEIGADIIGINNRNLKDFTIHLETTKKLSAFVPEDKVLVSESGVTKVDDILFLRECRVDAFLMGRVLMEAEHPKEIAESFKEAYHARN